ncbi:MAG TPA: polysaccharide biosynthesis C-terminal domain-containing protein [Actinomycetota bacterium]|nr:polysaccharide biosynthesis C-terminal domain-containing protein [Actinomycetota bacterium]
MEPGAPPEGSPTPEFDRGVGAGAPRRSDRARILAGTGQNILGLSVYVLLTFGMNVLIARAFGEEGRRALGVVTLATQLAFVAGAGTRFGMDHAAVRRVAIDVGKGEAGRIGGVVARAAAVAAVASIPVAAAIAVGADALSGRFVGVPRASFLAVAAAIPFVALSQVYLGATRGLKRMGPTLAVQWTGQPVSWLVLTLLAWAFSRTVTATVAAYALSWVVATAAAALVWRRAARPHGSLPPEPGELRALIRYGAPRAPAALLSQLLFRADYFVAYPYLAPDERGVYAAAVQLGFALVLFLTAVSYMFSPYVADLHARGRTEELDGLYKTVTRWTVAATIPVLLVLLVAPAEALHVFGARFETGTAALRILAVGQAVNVAVGAAGFILIMVGRTGWDLAIYAGSVALDVGLALVLAPRLGIEGAAIAQATTLVASNLARLLLVRRFVGIQPYDRRYLRLLAPAALGGVAMAAVEAILPDGRWLLHLSAMIVVGGGAFLAALLAVGLEPGERRAALGLARRLLA